MSKNIRTISARQIREGTLFQALTDAARESGKLTHEQLRIIAEQRLVSPATLLGTVSFYDFLKVDNSGKRAYVCNGTSCQLSGKHTAAHRALSTRYTEKEIGQATCMGRCYRGGAYWEGDQTFDAEYGADTVNPEGSDDTDPIPCFSAVPHSVFMDEVGSLDDFYSIVFQEPARIMEVLSASQLRGRGGAGFYFADKLAACAKIPGGQKYIVCNGDEGDPGAFSDRYLMEQQPHRVLSGMLVAGVTVGADTGYIYIRAEYPAAQTRMAQAIKAFEETAAFSQSGFRFHVIRGAGSYICGEETALLNSIEGLRPEVRIRPPYPSTEGLYGKPTLLSNVETFAALPWIMQHGGQAFSAIGTTKSTGTKLLSFDCSFNNPGVHEVAMGTPLEKVVHELGGGFQTDVKAVQIGGPLGSVVPMDKIGALSLDFESFEQQGFSLGHAGFIGIPREFPMIDLMRHLFSFMANESCGKCLPCRLGTEKGYRMLKQAAKGAPLDSAAFEDLLDTMELGSLCALGSGLPLPIRNIMEHFSAELAEYFCS